MPSADVISRLRAELETLSGPARIGSLVRLGEALWERYWRAGPGLPAALPELNAAIDAMGEAHRHMSPDDALRGHVAAMLGVLLGARHSAHGGPERDRETGIHVLEEAFTFPNLRPFVDAMARFALGQLYLSRAAMSLQSPGLAMASIQSGATPAAKADADRALACTRAVLAADSISEEITTAAKALLTLAEAMQTMLGGFGGGPAGFDLSRMMEALTMLQNLQNQAQAGNSPLTKLPFLTADALAGLDPLDRPVAVAYGPQPVSESTQRIRPQAAPVSVGRDELRQSLHAKLPASTNDNGVAGEVWARAAALLHPNAPLPSGDTIDDLVALASMVVDGQTGTDPGTAGVDWFLVAVTLHLRARLDTEDGEADRMAGTESLLLAVQTIPPEHPAAMTIFGALGAFLDDRRPNVANAFADRYDAVIAAGAVKQGADLATLHALRCLCRGEDGADLQRAVGTVPVDYPWLSQLILAAHAAVTAPAFPLTGGTQ